MRRDELGHFTPTGLQLTPQQYRYVQEYLIDPSSQTKAAIRAGYQISNATQSACRLMSQPKVKAAIAEGQQAAADRLGITQDRVLQEIALIAFSNLKDIISQNEDGTTTIDMSRMSREVAAALGEVSISEKGGKVKTRTAKAVLAGKLAALEKLGKHLGMFQEKVEHSGVLTLEQLVLSSLEEPTE